ncbi:paralemmin 1a isoform X1 [Thalassophryne amazonica]|uniref:paralemmin 1a isoform X1 n=1 Tax=Thalassophryne amazonica TaxID=390379 RepID=UPI001471A449|nr:paralemmin 1a isoform X1 [Thalassophryne amazonica]
MQLCELVSDQDRLQLIGEKRKFQLEVENKKRQLENDRRTLQHLKSKALRERWLLEGSPPAGADQREVKRQLEEDEVRTRTLEDTVTRLEQEIFTLEAGTHTAVPSETVPEAKVHKSPPISDHRETEDEMKRAVYSVEIKVERHKVTGETRVLSTHTTLPVDLSEHGVKVYEDEQKVVHEMNGEDGVHLLSSSEVEELIQKADQASLSQEVTVVTVRPPAARPPADTKEGALLPRVEITGLEAKPGAAPDVAEASVEKPVTMVFMGYQDVEDEDETKKVLGLQGTVKAQLVVIDDGEGKSTSCEEENMCARLVQMAALDPPGGTATPTATMAATPTVTPVAAPTATPTAAQQMMASNGDNTGEVEGGASKSKKKQPCKCCTIM